MVKYEFLVLFPGCDEIVRDSVENFTINLGLRGADGTSAIDSRHSHVAAHIMNSTRHPNLLPEFV